MNTIFLPRTIVPVLAGFALAFATVAATAKPALPAPPPRPTPPSVPVPPDPTAPPFNDAFANRQALPSATQLSVSGTTVNATQEAFEVAYSQGSAPGQGRNQTHTVWFSWTPTYSGLVHPSVTRNDGHQTYFLLFKGGSLPTASAVLDEGYLPAGTGAAPADFAVTAGQEYDISLGDTDFPGAFVLSLTQVSGAANAVLPVASVTAQGQAVRSTGTPGKFVLTLSEAADSDLTFNYRLGGNAVPGADYQLLPGSVTLPAGRTRVVLKIKPSVGADAANVRLRLEAGDGYTVGIDHTAKLGIAPGQ